MTSSSMATTVSVTGVTVDDPGLSDHSLVQWRFNLRLSSEPVYQERGRRLWRIFDLASFKAALTLSCLCDPAIYDSESDVNLLAQTYNDTVHAPRLKVRCRVRRKTDTSYDSDCRVTKRRVRKLERRYKRWKSTMHDQFGFSHCAHCTNLWSC